MNVDNLLTGLQDLEQYGGFQELTKEGHVLTQVEIGAVAAAILIGLLWCLLGLKLIRFWSAVAGLLIGFAIGGAIAVMCSLDIMYVLIIGGVAGIVMAVLCAGLYRVGIFVISLMLAGSLCFRMIQPQNFMLVCICAAVGLIVAVVAVNFAEPVIIVLTAVYGGIAAGAGIAILLPVHAMWVNLIISVVLAIMGMVVQFLMESGKKKRQHLKKAAEIRNTQSTANEVEKARAFMDNLDKKPETEEDSE